MKELVACSKSLEETYQIENLRSDCPFGRSSTRVFCLYLLNATYKTGIAVRKEAGHYTGRESFISLDKSHVQY